jgi:hypothetical protein
MQDECQWLESAENPDPLTLTIVPPAADRPARFDLLEDDGVSLRYQQGEVVCTPIVCRREGRQVLVEIGPAAGSYRGQPETRGYTLLVRGSSGIKTVPVPPAAIREKRSISSAIPAS